MKMKITLSIADRAMIIAALIQYNRSESGVPPAAGADLIKRIGTFRDPADDGPEVGIINHLRPSAGHVPQDVD